MSIYIDIQDRTSRCFQPVRAGYRPYSCTTQSILDIHLHLRRVQSGFLGSFEHIDYRLDSVMVGIVVTIGVMPAAVVVTAASDSERIPEA